MHTSPLLITSLLFFLGFNMVSCKPEEETKHGLSGHVSAPDGVSVAGTIVALYPAQQPWADVSVWSVPNQNSGVGFTYDVTFALDPRTTRPLQNENFINVVDTVDASGDFQFEDIVAGNYVVAALHSNGSWTRPVGVSSTGGDVDVGTLELPTVRNYSLDSLNNFITTNTTWTSGSCHFIWDNMFVNDGVTLTIEPGATVCLGGNKSLNIEGTLICRGTPEQFIVFAAADVISRDPDEWLQVRFFDGATPPDVAYCVFRNGSTAINSITNGGVVEYCFFERFINEGVLAQAQPPVVRRCVFDRTAVGFYAASTQNILIEHNVFQTCDPFAIWLDTDNDSTQIYCNWFRDCGGSDTSGSGTRGVVRMDLVSNCEVFQNTFETSWYAFQMGSRVDSTTYIHHNYFNRMSRCFNITVTEERQGPTYPLIRYNCFTTVENFVQFVHCNRHNYRDMYSTSNFWGTTSISNIQHYHIHDSHDDPDCPTVYYEPIMLTCDQISTETGIIPGVCN